MTKSPYNSNTHHLAARASLAIVRSMIYFIPIVSIFMTVFTSAAEVGPQTPSTSLAQPAGAGTSQEKTGKKATNGAIVHKPTANEIKSTQSEGVTSAKKAKVKTPREIVEEFYKVYIEERRPQERQKMSLSFSSGFHRLARENSRLCRQKAGTDVCGWESHGDIYFDSQEFDPNLSVKSAQLTVTEVEPEKIKVQLNVYPTASTKDPKFYQREITFVLLKEVSSYVVDDILYEDKSLRERIAEENSYLKKKPAPQAPDKMHR